MGIIPLLSSGHIMHVLRPNRQQHPRATGPDVTDHLNRGHVGKVGASPPCQLRLPGISMFHHRNQLSGCLHPNIPTREPSPGRQGRLGLGHCPQVPGKVTNQLLSQREKGCSKAPAPKGAPAQPHHRILFMLHHVVVHSQDPVSFLQTLALGRGAWLHPAHHRPRPAQLLLQVEPKIPAILFAQQTEARRLQAPETWRGRGAAEKGEWEDVAQVQATSPPADPVPVIGFYPVWYWAVRLNTTWAVAGIPPPPN